MVMGQELPRTWAEDVPSIVKEYEDVSAFIWSESWEDIKPGLEVEISKAI